MKSEFMIRACIASLMLLALSGCGKKESEVAEEAPEFVYTAEYSELPENIDSYNSFICGENLYYTSYEYDEVTYESTQTFTTHNMLTGDDTNTVLDFGDNEYLNHFYVPSDDSLLFLTASGNYDEVSQIYKQTFYLKKTDLEGNEIFYKDLSGVLGDSEDIYVQYMVTDADNNIYLSDGQSKIWLFDSNGEKTGEISISGWINGMAASENGMVAVCGYGDTGYEIQVLDFATGSILNTYKDIPSGSGNFNIGRGSGENILLSAAGSLYLFDLGSGEYTELLEWMNNDINYNNINCFGVIDSEKVGVMTCSYTETSSVNEMVILTKADSSTVTEKTTLVYGCLYIDSDVMEKIIAFNKSNEQYRIKIKEYGTDDWETAQTQMNADILSGEGPDIIGINSTTSVDMYINKGVFEDLSPFMEADSEIDTEDYLQNVLDLYSVDGKRYAIVPSFMISTVIGKTSILGERDGWNISEMLDFSTSIPEGVQLFQYATKDSMLSTLLMYSLDDYIDWSNGTCSFDSDEFVNILKFANQFDSEFDYSEEEPSTPELIQTNQLALVQTTFSDITEFQMYKNLFDEPITTVGFPSSDREGTIIQASSATLAISSKSDYKEAAWEFVRTFLLPEYQDEIQWYVPILQSSLEKLYEEAMTKDYYTDLDGNQIENPKTSWGWDDFQTDIYAATQEDVDSFNDMIASAKKGSSYDSEIYSIVSEEAASYFEGAKTPEEVAEIIQSRMQIYISENS